MEEAGCTVLSADSVEGALEVVATAEFDGALLDYQMPGMNGLQLAERLRLITASKARPSPIWLMTEAPTPEIYQRASELRVRNVFLKPLHVAPVVSELLLTLGSIASAEFERTQNSRSC
jgi:CheY-like chemotaxis protein